MKVSVVMPIFNAAPYIKDTIVSLLNQTYTNWELIAVDDGSTDESLSIVQSFSDSRIRILKRTNGGQCAATNTGLQYADGDYLQFLDADDILDKEKISVQVKVLEEGGNKGIAISRWGLFSESPAQSLFNDEPIFFSDTPSRWLYRLWTNETMMPNLGYLIPREILEMAGKFYNENLQLNIDFEYFTRMVLVADKIVFAPNAICHYRKGVKSAKTYNPSFQKSLSALESRSLAIRYLLEKDNTDQSKYACKMALTILTYTYPKILSYSTKVLHQFELGKFGKFGGMKFRFLQSLIGFENAIQVKRHLF